MPLSEAVRKGLEADLARLEAEKKRLEVEVRSIRELLGVETGSNGSKPTRAVTTPGPLSGLGFRDAIRAVLRNSPKPLKARLVAEAIERGGWENTSTVPLGTRTSNELWRMRERGLVERTGKAYHSPKDTGTNDEENVAT